MHADAIADLAEDLATRPFPDDSAYSSDWLDGLAQSAPGAHFVPIAMSESLYETPADDDARSTPNYTIGILDPAGPDLFGGTSTATFPNRVYKASTVSRDQLIEYFSSMDSTTSCFPRSAPTRSASTRWEFPPAAC